MFFGAEPDDSFVKPEEMMMMKMMPRMRKAKWAHLEKRWVDPINLNEEALNEGDHHLHGTYVIRRSRRSVEEMLTYSVGQSEHTKSMVGTRER